MNAHDETCADCAQEVFDWARALAWCPLPSGRRIAVLTNAGGPGAIAVDALDAYGLRLAQLSEATRARLREFLPEAASVRNPVDMQAAAGAAEYANGLGALLGALTVAAYGNRMPRRLMILGGLWVISAMLLLLAAVRWYPLVLACMAGGGWGMLLYFATTNTLIQTSVSDAMRGRVMGIWALVVGGMMPIGGLESGLLSQAVGVPLTVAVGAAICGGAGLVTWMAVRRQPAWLRRHRTQLQ